ncbi:MAG: aminotransferase class V-fold PLP-dependent enzyme [Gammaproteobacteria bacterium]
MLFLNYAATAPLLKQSADHMINIIRQGTEPLSLHIEAWLAEIESARAMVANTIHASAEEITFTTNTSSALSLMAESIVWQHGDRVLFPSDEFPSNRYVWQNLTHKGVMAESFATGDNIIETLSNMPLHNVKLLALSAVSYENGRGHDITALTQFCHDRGILVAIDGIQAVGAIPVNVKQWDCDFLACGGQKWLLGPVGSGFLFINKRILPSLFVPTVGWASMKNAGDFNCTSLTFCDGARRFEPGLPDVAVIAGLSKSIQTLSTMGWDHIFSTLQHHKKMLMDNIKPLGYPLLSSEGPYHSGIVTLRVSPHEKTLIQKACHDQNIIVTFRNDTLRISPHASNTPTELETMIRILQKAKNVSQSIITTAVPHNFSILPPSDPSFKNALITGATQGLGKALAIELAKRGCNVHLIARDQAALSRTAHEIKEYFPVEVQTSVVDLADPKQVDNFIQHHHMFDVLVNNAASADAHLVTDLDFNDVQRSFEVNCFSPIRLIKAFLPHMIEKKYGAILNIVTSGSRCALPLFSDYAASKGALWSFSEALTREMHDTGVNVTTFVPPHMPTITAHRLGRKALSYYRRDEKSTASVQPEHVAQQAIDALFSNNEIIVPWATRLSIAINALFPAWVSKRIKTLFCLTC